MATSNLHNYANKNTPLLVRVGYSFNYNVSGGGTQWINVTASPPDGYQFIGISSFDTGANGYNLCIPTANQYGVRVTNLKSTAVSGSGTITFLYIRTDIAV